MQTKDFKFELKALGDDGTFEGYLSVFNVIDLGNDVVEPGAFTKTIQEQKGVVPLLWQHRTDKPIGTLTLQEDQYGLKVNGKLLLEVQQGHEAYTLVKSGVIKGLSIGFEAIKKQVDKGIRKLKEIRLYEGSIVTFPMLPIAQITAIKSIDGKSDFATELQEIQTRAMRYMMLDALSCSLCDALYEMSMSAEEKIQASSDSIDQFKTAYMDFLPNMFALMAEMAGMEMNSAKAQDIKAGRMISAANRTMIEEAIARLQALLDAADGTSAEEAADPAPVAAETKHEPEGNALHSWLSESLAAFESQLAAIQ